MNFNFAKLLSVSVLAFFASQHSSLAQDTKAVKQTNQKVQAIYETLYGGVCRSLMEGNTPHQPTIHTLAFNYGDEDYPERPYRLYEYLCFEGPYSQSYVYFGTDEYQEVTHLTFSVPTYDIAYQNDDSYGAVQSIKLTGYTTIDQVPDGQFIPESKTISSFAKWRGPADAFSSGVWKFEEGQFVLQEYEVDAEYDGERKPTVIYGDGPPRLFYEGEGQ